jgi:hypothetical protein
MSSRSYSFSFASNVNSNGDQYWSAFERGHNNEAAKAALARMWADVVVKLDEHRTRNWLLDLSSNGKRWNAELSCDGRTVRI